nr:MAG TPA: hypothetical protein [Caudoviricetes sp.]
MPNPIKVCPAFAISEVCNGEAAPSSFIYPIRDFALSILPVRTEKETSILSISLLAWTDLLTITPITAAAAPTAAATAPAFVPKPTKLVEKSATLKLPLSIPFAKLPNDTYRFFILPVSDTDLLKSLTCLLL